jgi:hypothetical protein
MIQRHKRSGDIVAAAELWTTSLMPEGLIERWLCHEGSIVKAGTAVALVRIEDSLHELTSPCDGLLHVDCHTDAVVEPGMVIGSVSPTV